MTEEVVSVTIIIKDSKGNEQVIEVPKSAGAVLIPEYTEPERLYSFMRIDPISIIPRKLIGLTLSMKPRSFNETGHIYTITQKVTDA